MSIVVIVLGYRLADNGEPQEEIKGRVSRGIEVFKKEKAEKLILSGGMANLKSGKTEGEVMATLAFSEGISEEDMILEEASLDTIGNAYFSKQIVKKYGWKKLYVITSCYHVERSSFIFNMCYGNEYELNFEHCYSSGEEAHERKTLERMQLEAAKAFFRRMKRGDDSKLERRIYHKHKLYRR